MPVTVRYDDIVSQWALPECDRTIWLELAGPSDSASQAAVGTAIERTNAVAAIKWVESGVAAGATAPLRVHGGVVFRLECLVDEGPRGWLSELVDQLSADDVSGVVRAYRVPEVGLFRTLADGRPGSSAAIVLSLSGWGPGPGSLVTPPWKVHPELVPDLVELVLDFLVDDRPSALQMDNGTLVDVTRTTICELLPPALAMPLFEVPMVWVRQSGGEVNRQISFDPFGRVLLNAVADEVTLLEELQRPMTLATSWATRCDWVILLENALGGTFDDAYSYARSAHLPRAIGRGRGQDTSPLPDAFPWSVLPQSQVPVGLDPDKWSVAPVADGRLLVESRTLDAWLTMSRPTKTATPESLSDARHDWGIIS